MAKLALNEIQNGNIKVLPSRFIQTFENWLNNIKDWCISRQLWWGHQIPVWYIIQEDKSRKSNEKEYIVARNEVEALEKAKIKYGDNVKLERDPDVLDTWFSSGLWPFSTLGWPDLESPDYKRFFPTQVLETGHDILFFWVARMIMMSLEFTGNIPFSMIYLHGLVRDAQGRKMSKSLGNVIDPNEVILQYGTDPLRFALATGTGIGQDLNLNTERLVSARNFSNKVWNIGKFIGSNLPDNDTEFQDLAYVDYGESIKDLSLSEKWIISRLHVIIDRITIAHERYDLIEIGRELYDFVWFDFADWFVESSKTALYNSESMIKQNNAQKTLVYCFDKILKLLHPFMPFLTETLWQSMPHDGQALIIAPWPKQNLIRCENALNAFSVLQDIVRAVRNARAEYNVELSRKIPAKILIPENALLEDLKDSISIMTLLAKIDHDNFYIGLPSIYFLNNYFMVI